MRKLAPYSLTSAQLICLQQTARFGLLSVHAYDLVFTSQSQRRQELQQLAAVQLLRRHVISAPDYRGRHYYTLNPCAFQYISNDWHAAYLSRTPKVADLLRLGRYLDIGTLTFLLAESFSQNDSTHWGSSSSTELWIEEFFSSSPNPSGKFHLGNGNKQHTFFIEYHDDCGETSLSIQRLMEYNSAEEQLGTPILLVITHPKLSLAKLQYDLTELLQQSSVLSQVSVWSTQVPQDNLPSWAATALWWPITRAGAESRELYPCTLSQILEVGI